MTAATATLAATPFAQELQALKSELQRTLARLGTAPAVQVREPPTTPWSHASTTTATYTNTTTPTTVRSDAASRHSQASPVQSDMTERILHELVATARRRRQVEMHMARELERELRVREDAPSLTWGRPAPAARDTSRVPEREQEEESAIHSEIEALRLRRKQILVEIDNESKHGERERAASKPQPTTPPCIANSAAQDTDVSNVSASIKRRNENEYSIEGVVKLGSLLARQSNQDTASQTIPPRSSHHHHRPQQVPQFPSLHSSPLYGGYRHQHHDMMQDVFAIQLKFAETMLQLEKSIQTRDQLLVSTSVDRSRRRSTASSRRNAAPLRRRTRLPSTIHEDRERDPAESSDDDLTRSHAMSSDEASMSEDTLRMWRRYRPRSASSPGTAPESVTTTTTTSTSPHSQPSPGQSNDHDDPTSPLASSPSHELLVTPTTNDSGNKQVHFTVPTDDYATPLIARNISFDQDSIDSTDDDHTYARTVRRHRNTMVATATFQLTRRTRPTAVSWDEDEALSFLEGSSVCSADLQDESFLTAFYALRRELLGDRLGNQTPTATTGNITTRLQQPVTPTKNDVVPEPVVEPVVLDLASLQRQKRGLTLDIQASTAKLVLAKDATQRQQASAALDRLRRQLQTIQAQEAAAAAVSS